MIRDRCFLPWNGGFKPPTSDEIREFLQDHRITGSKAGEIVGVDSRTIRRWTGGDRSMPYAAWRLLVIEVAPELTQMLPEGLDDPPFGDPDYDWTGET